MTEREKEIRARLEDAGYDIQSVFRTDIRYLLDEVDRLRELTDTMDNADSEMSAYVSELEAEAGDLRKERDAAKLNEYRACSSFDEWRDAYECEDCGGTGYNESDVCQSCLGHTIVSPPPDELGDMDARNLAREVRRLRGQIAEVRGLLDDAFDPDAHDSADLYDAQGVNQAHRVAAGGFAPRDTATD